MNTQELRTQKQSPWPWWMVELDRQTSGRGMLIAFPSGATLKDGSRLSPGTVLPEQWHYVEATDKSGAASAELQCRHGFLMLVKNPPGTQHLFKSREADVKFLQEVLRLHARDYYNSGHSEYAL